MWKVGKGQTQLNLDSIYKSISTNLDINLWKATSHTFKDTCVEMDSYFFSF